MRGSLWAFNHLLTTKIFSSLKTDTWSLKLFYLVNTTETRFNFTIYTIFHYFSQSWAALVIRYVTPPLTMWPAWQTALIPSTKDSFYSEGSRDQDHRSSRKKHQTLCKYSRHWMHSIAEHMLRLRPRAYTWSSIGPGNGRQCWPPRAPLTPTVREGKPSSLSAFQGSSTPRLPLLPRYHLTEQE